MLAIHPDAELAPRDIVARGVFAEIAAGRGAFLDCRTAIGAGFAERFPDGFMPSAAGRHRSGDQPIPVAPAAHYHMGGVSPTRMAAPRCRALGCGEVASTGVHGANRLASNSLLEAVVFAARIADDLLGDRCRGRRIAS